MNLPSGMIKTWKLWRHCCCRYGCYPLMIVPITTMGCLLSVLSTVGCKFVEINIGFDPVNAGWNATAPYYFGHFYYYNSSLQYDNAYEQSFHGGCLAYTDNFNDDFLSIDRTFKMTRIMAMIAAAASTLAMTTTWTFIICPFPVGYLWSGLMLPASVVSLICEGSKFLLFDTSLCRSSMWYRGSYPAPEAAESCIMGETGWYACAAGVLHLWTLVMVCVRVPKRRTLSQSFGVAVQDVGESIKDVQETTSDDNDLEAPHCDSENSLKAVMSEGNYVGKKLDGMENTLEGKAFSTTFMPIGSGDLAVPCWSPALGEKRDLHTPPIEPPTDLEKPEERRVMSPVDYMIQGFNVATDLSSIDVCGTMVLSSAPRNLPPEENATAVKELYCAAPGEMNQHPASPTATTSSLPEAEYFDAASVLDGDARVESGQTTPSRLDKQIDSENKTVTSSEKGYIEIDAK